MTAMNLLVLQRWEALKEKCTKTRYIQKPHLQVILMSLMGRVVVVIFFADCRWNCDACHSDILAPKAESRLHVESATGIQLRQHQKSSLTTLSPHILKPSPTAPGSDIEAFTHHLLQIPERNTSTNKIIILRLPHGILPAIIRLEGPPDACTRASRTAAYQAAIPIQIRPSSSSRPSMNTDASKAQ